MYQQIIHEAKLNSLSLADLSALIRHLEGQQTTLLDVDNVVNQSLYRDDKKALEQQQARLSFLDHALEVCWERRRDLVAQIVMLKTPCGQNAFAVALSDHEAPFVEQIS